MRHPRPDSIRLKPLHRYSLYAALTVLFLSGALWAWFNYLFDSSSEIVAGTKSWSLKIHGASAMATLVLIGTVLSTHVRFAWRARRNRVNGLIFLGTFAALTVTGYGLYYFGGEKLRAWTSWIHLAIGLALPAILVAHIGLGRKTRPTGRPARPPRASVATPISGG